ncbi:MAG: dihydroorotase [Bacteroidetes bacterium]|nr:dihydroorotase [Bacteroidota bacterium]MBS1629181.1 dihydroorotase [Bacteroidota bacterium]
MSQADLLIKNATIVNEGHRYQGDVLIQNGRIEKIASQVSVPASVRELDAQGLHLLPGVIDDQVHFREPGLTNKACIETESKAAVAGGVTSFMEMPNTKPPALTQELLEQKYARAAQCSPANYSFFMGVSNENAEEVLRTNAKKKEVCGVKIFMGSSTGSMLVDNYVTLRKIFEGSELLIATHCESEPVITANKAKYPEADDVRFHPLIRNVEACFESSFSAVQLAKQTGARLHILHISTAKELQLFSNMLPLREKQITSEVCVHHLHFTAEDYAQFGTLIQCNPAIKAPEHREALWEALLDDRLDIIATDHAPHTWEEKQQPYPQAPSGVPLVQHSLLLMLQYVKAGKISIEKVVEKMSHAPAKCFRIQERGYIREGYAADLVLVDLEGATQVSKENLYYRCGWSPFEGHRFPARITHTIVNGHVVYENGAVQPAPSGQRLLFER